MVYDTGYNTDDFPRHKCGKVLDHCIVGDTKIYFCIFCKKAKFEIKDYNDETLLDNI